MMRAAATRGPDGRNKPDEIQNAARLDAIAQASDAARQIGPGSEAGRGLTIVDGGRLIGGIRNIFPTATAAPTLAHTGGTVLATSLDQAVFEGNTFSGLSLGALVLGATQTVQFTRNQVTGGVSGGSGGFWLVSPLQSGLIAYDPNTVALMGLTFAIGYPLPQNDATPAAQMVTVPAASSVRIYAGPTTIVDSLGYKWLPDIQAGKLVTISGGDLAPVPPPATQPRSRMPRRGQRIRRCISMNAGGAASAIHSTAWLRDIISLL